MKLASKKNMMSINGMISMRARLCGMGEASRINLIGRARHRVSDGHFYFRRTFTGLKSPASECANGCVVQDRVADGLRHRCISHIAAGGINAQESNAAAGDVTAARFVGVVRF